AGRVRGCWSCLVSWCEKCREPLCRSAYVAGTEQRGNHGQIVRTRGDQRPAIFGGNAADRHQRQSQFACVAKQVGFRVACAGLGGGRKKSSESEIVDPRRGGVLRALQ